MPSLFNEYEDPTRTALDIDAKVAQLVKQLFEEYGEQFPIREIEAVILFTVHAIACETIIKNGIDKRKQLRHKDLRWSERIRTPD